MSLPFPAFPDFPDFFQTNRLTFAPFHVRVISGFFRSYPDWPSRDKLVPFPVPVISGVLQFSDFFRIGPPVAKLISFMFVSFPDLSGFSDFSGLVWP